VIPEGIVRENQAACPDGFRTYPRTVGNAHAQGDLCLCIPEGMKSMVVELGIPRACPVGGCQTTSISIRRLLGGKNPSGHNVRIRVRMLHHIQWRGENPDRAHRRDASDNVRSGIVGVPDSRRTGKAKGPGIAAGPLCGPSFAKPAQAPGTSRTFPCSLATLSPWHRPWLLRCLGFISTSRSNPTSF